MLKDTILLFCIILHLLTRSISSWLSILYFRLWEHLIADSTNYLLSLALLL